MSLKPVYITKTGKWMVGEDLGSIKLFTDPTKKIEPGLSKPEK